MYSRAASREKPHPWAYRDYICSYALHLKKTVVGHVGRRTRAQFSIYNFDTVTVRATVVKIVVDSLLSNRPLDEPLPTHFFLEAARFFLGFSTSASA